MPTSILQWIVQAGILVRNRKQQRVAAAPKPAGRCRQSGTRLCNYIAAPTSLYAHATTWNIDETTSCTNHFGDTVGVPCFRPISITCCSSYCSPPRQNDATYATLRLRFSMARFLGSANSKAWLWLMTSSYNYAIPSSVDPVLSLSGIQTMIVSLLVLCSNSSPSAENFIEIRPQLFELLRLQIHIYIHTYIQTDRQTDSKHLTISVVVECNNIRVSTVAVRSLRSMLHLTIVDR